MYCEAAFFRMYESIYFRPGEPVDAKDLEVTVEKDHPIVFPLFIDAHFHEVQYVMTYIHSPVLQLPRVRVTAIFDQFIKGVTYFQSQSYVQEPTYGRLRGYQHIECEIELKKRLETCYIEQQIFAAIMNYMGGDMEPYRDLLQETKMDLIRYFPGLEIDVTLVWDHESKVPMELIVTKQSYTARYIRDRTSPYVTCIRETNKCKYFHVQTFLSGDGMEIDALFYDVSKEVRLLQLTGSTSFTTLSKCLKSFEKTLQKSDAALISLFLSVHKEELCRISRALRGWSSKNASLRAYDDKIFKKYFQFKKSIPTQLTILFQDFIKGLTYFQYQTGTEVPIYHRLFACGPGDDAFRKEFQICSQDIEPHRMDDIKRRVETCYIERLIYDAMYREYTLFFPERGDSNHEQDEGHRHRIQVTKDDFGSCFPNITIQVHVQWDTTMPIRLTILRYNNGVLESKEIYTRTIDFFSSTGKVYNPLVESIRLVNEKKYFRIQTFEHVGRWKALEK